MRRSWWSGVGGSLLTLAASGCADLPTVQYVPQPDRVAEPKKALEEMLLAAPPKPLKVEVTDTYFMVLRDNKDGTARTEVVPFANAHHFMILHPDWWYAVWVDDASGAGLYMFEADDLATAERFIDAVASGSARASR